MTGSQPNCFEIAFDGGGVNVVFIQNFLSLIFCWCCCWWVVDGGGWLMVVDVIEESLCQTHI